jgi:hypothetical protein
MEKKLLHIVSRMLLALALLGLFILATSPAPIIVRIVAASVGISVGTVMGIVFFTLRKRDDYGE